MPLVTVMLPAYQAGPYIERCVDSILGGSFADMEILIVDDGSAEDSAAVYAKLLEKDRRVRLFRQEHSGVSAARNTGIEEARGKYIAFVDADDRVSGDYLEKLIGFAEGNDLDWAACSYVYEGSDIRILPAFPDETVLSGKELSTRLRKALFAGPSDNILSSSAMGLYRLDVVRESGVRFRPELAYGEDLVFNDELSRCIGRFGYLPEALYRYTIHVASATGGRRKKQYMQDRLNLLRCLEEIRENLGDEYIPEYLSYTAGQIRQIFQFDLLRRGTRAERQRGYAEIMTALKGPDLEDLWKTIGEEYRPAEYTHQFFFSLLKRERLDWIEFLQPFAKRVMQVREVVSSDLGNHPGL